MGRAQASGRAGQLPTSYITGGFATSGLFTSLPEAYLHHNGVLLETLGFRPRIRDLRAPRGEEHEHTDGGLDQAKYRNRTSELACSRYHATISHEQPQLGGLS
jgi:hypothetical protein